MKTSTTVLLSVLLACQWVQAQEEEAHGSVFYMSLYGADSGDGTKEQPFRTLERARAVVRKARQKDTSAMVYLRGRVYERVSTFELNEQDSRSMNAPVIWRAYPGEAVTILGGRQIAGSMVKPVTDKDPGFVNMAQGEFTLKEDSVAYRKIPGFEPVPFAKMGLYRDRWRMTIPERTGFSG